MTRRVPGYGAAAVAAVAVATLYGTSTSAQTVVMATDKVGTILNAAGAGMADIVTNNSPLRVVVRTYAGQDVYVAGLDRHEVDMAPLSAFGAWLHFTGRNKQKHAYRNMRLLRASNGGLLQSYVTRASSDIKTVADLKGKRIASGFGATPLLQLSTNASLAAAGLSMKDVTGVPVSGIAAAVKTLGAGRVDATWTAFGVPVVREINARTPVRFLPIPNDPAALKILRKMLYPGVRVVPVRANPRMGLSKVTPMVTYDIYLVARKGLAPKKVQAVLAALWDNTEKLRKVHRILKPFTHKGAATDLAALPYHPAAIAFYKSKGQWTAAMQQNQDRMMALAK